MQRFVVEGLILKGYYNSIAVIILVIGVVEGLILKGYYNRFYAVKRTANGSKY